MHGEMNNDDHIPFNFDFLFLVNGKYNHSEMLQKGKLFVMNIFVLGNGLVCAHRLS